MRQTKVLELGSATIKLLPMDRPEVEARTDVQFLQFLHELVAADAGPLSVQPNDEQVPGVLMRINRINQRDNFLDRRKFFAIEQRPLSSQTVHLADPLQLHQTKGGGHV